MKNPIALAFALTALLAVSGANALTSQSGIISSVDVTNQTLTISNKSGKHSQYRLSKNTRVIVDGKLQNVAALASNQNVQVKLESEATAKYVKAEILNIDLEKGIAQVQPKGSNKSIKIRLNESTKVSGKVNSLEKLAAGQQIKIRYSAKI